MCADDDIASEYLPAAVPFVRAKDHRLASEKRKWKYYKRSGPFDFDNIMIYNSLANSPGNVDGMDPENWVFRRKGKNGGPVWQGGSPKAAEARISEGDAARVCSVPACVIFLIHPFDFLHLHVLTMFTGRTTVP